MAGGENGKHAILIAEDSQVLQLWFESQLEQLGVDYELAANGREAVEKFANGRFDLILMDCQMPVMDGFTAARMIREKEKVKGGHVPIIAMTAGTSLEEREACREAGMDDLMAKPVKIEEMKKLLDRWLKAGAGNDTGLAEDGPNPPPEPEPVSMGRLQELVGEDEKLKRIVLSDYLKNSRQLMDQIEKAALNHDFWLLGQAAHRFRPINDFLGANNMVALLSALEEGVKKEDSQQIGSLLPLLKSEYDRVLAALENISF